MRKVAALIIVFIVLVSNIYCGEKGEKYIITSFYPIYIMTKNIVKDVPGVKVINMTKPQTGCLHDYSLTAADMKLLEKGDYFIINGKGMESFLDKVIRLRKNLKIIEGGKGIEGIKTNGEENPHLWVSISNAINETENIARGLAALDIVNGEKYLKNSVLYTEKLRKLKLEMDRELKPFNGETIITFHEAFPYFAKEFGLKIAAVIEREPGSEPSAKELAETISIIKKSKVKALYVEPQYSAKSAQTIARETGVKVYMLDPGVTGAEDDESYLRIMKKNLQTLKESLN